MPGHFQRGGNREFRDPESRTHQVMGQARHFVEIVCGAVWAIHDFIRYQNGVSLTVLRSLNHGVYYGTGRTLIVNGHRRWRQGFLCAR